MCTRNPLATDVFHGTIFNATGAANRVLGWLGRKLTTCMLHEANKEQNSLFGVANF